MSTQFIIVRHGESKANKKHLYAGLYDLGLTKNGIKHAKYAVEGLKKRHIDAVYTSPLPRAEVTAMYIAAAKKLPLHVEYDLHEYDFGVYDGKPYNPPQSFIDEGDEYMVTAYRDFRKWNYKGGESVKKAAYRFKAALEKIAKANDGKTVVIVSHAAVLASFATFNCADWDEDKLITKEHVPNASFTFVTYTSGKFDITDYGNCDHLHGNVVRFKL